MAVYIPDELLLGVSKPTRYIGNELNSVHKDPEKVAIRFVFCFPDVYEVGMSHLGIKILYHLLNERDDVYCERVFTPWPDMENEMRQRGIPLFALETRDRVADFDFLGFTLQYEMSYTNVINTLDLAGIPIYRKDRRDGHPFVCAGGPCAYNPEPLTDIIDFFVLGEGEEVINDIMDAYREWKGRNKTREEFLETVSHIGGVYVPGFFDVEYNDDGTVKRIFDKRDGKSKKITKRIIRDLDKAYFPDRIIVPFMGVVHDRIMLEIFRGCIRGCRFCQAGFVYRPVRERSPENLMVLARKVEKNTGYEEISLVSLSTSDYSHFDKLAWELMQEMEPKKINLSFPSLRLDSFSLNLLRQAQKVRKSGLTFAPEAGTQRLRDVINKGITEEDLLNACDMAFRAGWNNVKLYFMIGLPTETYEDLDGITALGEKVVGVYQNIPPSKRAPGLNVTISASSFVPKPFTPFQWEAQDTMEQLKEKQKYLRKAIRNKRIKFNWHDPETSFLEGVFSRGDRKLGQVLVKAWQKGCRFDAWEEHFKFDAWMEAFEECGIDPGFYTSRKRREDEVMPWEHIDVGVTKGFLANEREKAYRGELTKNCREGCAGCGAAVFGGGICVDDNKD